MNDLEKVAVFTGAGLGLLTGVAIIQGRKIRKLERGTQMLALAGKYSNEATAEILKLNLVQQAEIEALKEKVDPEEKTE